MLGIDIGVLPGELGEDQAPVHGDDVLDIRQGRHPPHRHPGRRQPPQLLFERSKPLRLRLLQVGPFRHTQHRQGLWRLHLLPIAAYDTSS